MQEQVDNQTNGINQEEPKRNGSAIASLVLSLVSIVLCPILLIQILCLIFGGRGLKSEKKGFAVAGIIISTCTILLGLFISFNYIFTPTPDTRRVDMNLAGNIQKAVSACMVETQDASLGGVSTVDELFEILINGITVNGKFYEPYIIGTASEFEPQNKKYKGWEIIIYKDRLYAKVSPSEVGDSLVFIDNSKQ